jgi:HK97 family phage prohead protease
MNNTGLQAQGRTISGYAIVFNVKSTWIREQGRLFREIIKPEAISQSFINTQDIKAKWQHDQSNGILARSKEGAGTLKLTVDNIGLRYSFIAKDTALGNEVLAMVTDGDVTESSFSYSPTRDGMTITRDDEGELHIITKIERITDVSPVVQGAYAETGQRQYITDNQIENYLKLEKLNIEVQGYEKAIKKMDADEAQRKVDDIDFRNYSEAFKIYYSSEPISPKLRAAAKKDIDEYSRKNKK